MVVKELTCFLARFKEKTITLDSVMKMSGGKVGIVMVLLEKKGKKRLNTFFPITESLKRGLLKRSSTGM